MGPRPHGQHGPPQQCPPHLGIEQQEQRVFGGGVGPPLQHIGQEQELREGQGGVRPGAVPGTSSAPTPPLGGEGSGLVASWAPPPPTPPPYLPCLVTVLQVRQLPP